MSAGASPVMPTSFDGGFADPFLVKGIPLQVNPSGKVFWVDSTASRGGGAKGSYAAPVSTLDSAINKCKAGRGDIIFVMPTHVETLSTATALNLDIADVSIIGLGRGLRRPTFTLDTIIGATIPVSAASISIANCIFTANFADITAVFTLTAAKDFVLAHNLFKATATNMNFLNIVDTSTVDNAADGLSLIGNKWIEPDTATLSMVQADNSLDRVTFLQNVLNLGVNNNKPALLNLAAGKIVTNVDMCWNRVRRLNTDTATGGILIATDGTTSTGMIAFNQVQHADSAAEILVTASNSWGVFENRASGVAGASGYLLPAADS